MKIMAYAAIGFMGRLVSVEVDIRRGIPGMDVVGLPDGAVREARERVRIALKRSGFQFPQNRILVNLSPAGLRKEGAAYDLPIALGVLIASGQLTADFDETVLCIGELMLDGSVRPVYGVLPAVAAALGAGIRRFFVPAANSAEAASLEEGNIHGIVRLDEFTELLNRLRDPAARRLVSPVSGTAAQKTKKNPAESQEFDMEDLRGQPVLRRALEVAAAGGHHLLIFGPPGCGKTMAARILPSLLPDLDREGALQATRVHSLAGRLRSDGELIIRPPFREPHHSASAEGVIGGGNIERPGEVSLAHKGILFLDETPEFGTRILQALREPLESRRVDLARAGRSRWYPAEFQLVLAMNPCPCGNLGREEAICLCGPGEMGRYWRRLGGALLDRIDIRVPVSPVAPETLLASPGESSHDVRSRVEEARDRQARRYRENPWWGNAGVPPRKIETFMPLSDSTVSLFAEAARKLGLSSRAVHSVLRVARTIADLTGNDKIEETNLLEALQHRRFGDRDLFWGNL